MTATSSASFRPALAAAKFGGLALAATIAFLPLAACSDENKAVLHTSTGDYTFNVEVVDTNETRARIGALKDAYAEQMKAAQALDAMDAKRKADAAATRDATQAEREHAEAVKQANADLARLADMADQAAGRLSGPVNKAWSDSAARIRDVASLVADLTMQLERQGVPAVHLDGTDVAEAYKDVVARFLGEDKALRFTDYQKPGLLQRLFGTK